MHSDIHIAFSMYENLLFIPSVPRGVFILFISNTAYQVLLCVKLRFLHVPKCSHCTSHEEMLTHLSNHFGALKLVRTSLLVR